MAYQLFSSFVTTNNYSIYHLQAKVVCLMLQVLNQDETPLLYSLVFGEGVVNDATSVVLFNAIQSFDLSHIDSSIALQFVGSFFYLFITSTFLGVLVSLSHSLCFFLASPHSDYKYFFFMCFYNFQTGLVSAYVIKRLYFGRFVS